MNRRAYLRAVGVGSIAASAGCLSSVVGDGSGSTVLDPPENRQFDSEDIPYPAYGQEFPDFSLPAPLADTTIDTADLETTLLVTGFFATCPAECVRLIGQLAGVQRGVIENGIGDEVTILPITFDPRRDDEESLRAYAEKMNVDIDAGNWHFLRPPSEQRARAVVADDLGITYDRVGAGETERLPGYDFRHLSLTFLRNPDGLVERAYRTDNPAYDRVLDDVQTVVEASA
jgi:protein SCO1/2